MSSETWYLLFQGQSCDGRGDDAEFVKRTTSKMEAKRFYVKDRKNPYSTSKVIYVTDTEYEQIDDSTDWGEL